MLGGPFGVAFQCFHSTRPSGAAASGALHIFQCRQERSLGPTTIYSPYWNNNQCLETNVWQPLELQRNKVKMNRTRSIKCLSETLLRSANFLRQHVNTRYWLQPTGKKQKYCIGKNKMLLHGVYRVCKEQSPDVRNCCAICLHKLPFLHHSSLS